MRPLVSGSAMVRSSTSGERGSVGCAWLHAGTTSSSAAAGTAISFITRSYLYQKSVDHPFIDNAIPVRIAASEGGAPDRYVSITTGQPDHPEPKHSQPEHSQWLTESP